MVLKFLGEPQRARGLFIIEHRQDKMSDDLRCQLGIDVFDCYLFFGTGSNPNVGLAISSFNVKILLL